MDGIAVGLDRHADDVVHRQIGGDGAERLADGIGFVGLEAVEGEAVLVREDRDRGLAHLVGRAQDADRDLAPVRHQNSFEFAHRSARPRWGRFSRTRSAFYTDVRSCGSRRQAPSKGPEACRRRRAAL